jgi:DNA-binding MarR family transcriptional regulator
MSDDLPESPLLGMLLRQLGQHYGQAVQEALRAHGFGDLRPSHANVFFFARPDGIAITELARLARVRRQSMAQAVQELVGAGYAELRDNPRDRRSKLVFLTEDGQAVWPTVAAAGGRVEEQWASLIGREQLESLRTAMLGLLAALRSHDGHTPLNTPSESRLASTVLAARPGSPSASQSATDPISSVLKRPRPRHVSARRRSCGGCCSGSPPG